MAKNWYIVAYDIRDSTRLNRAAKLVKGYGTRLQYSVFRCCLTVRQVEKLRWEITRLLTMEDDYIIIELCSSCVNRIRKRGGEMAWPEEPPTFEIV
jgi:CRISPR-associated protein Cas2